MAFLPGKQNHSYKHICAETPEELERMMLQIAIQSYYPVTFSCPSFSEGKWFAWYNHDWSKELLTMPSEQPKKSRKTK